MSDQTRAVIAAGLALIVILGWGFFFKAPPPSQPQPQSGITISQSTGAQNTGASTPSQLAPAPQQVTAAPHPATSAASAAPAVSASGEQNITIEGDLYRVVLSNRGAVARS